MKKPKVLPFPVASIVRFKTPVDPKGFWPSMYENEIANCGTFLIEEITEGPEYSILGHKKLKTKGENSAWHVHDELELVSEPTVESWAMLWQAKED